MFLVIQKLVSEPIEIEGVQITLLGGPSLSTLLPFFCQTGYKVSYLKCQLPFLIETWIFSSDSFGVYFSLFGLLQENTIDSVAYKQ